MVLMPFFSLALFPNYRKHLHRNSNPGQYWDCTFCPCNFLAKTNNFGFGAVFLSCLFSELQKPPSPGLEYKTLTRSADISRTFSWIQEQANQFWGKLVCPSRAIYEQTYTYACTHTYVRTYTHTYTRAHTYMHTYMHTYTHTHTYKPTYIHTYIHTYLHTQNFSFI
jgi:hypothetical protein